MYESFYGLRELPFDLTPNPRFLYLSAKHREALRNIEYGISSKKGVTVCIGEAGTGKTTIVRAALVEARRRQTYCVYITNPTLTRGEFYQYLAVQLGLSARAAQSKALFLLELPEMLGTRREMGQATALVIDEAHALPLDLVEEVRLLANLETSTEKLLPLVLVGQPELADALERPEYRQFKQRVALRCELPPLNLQETAAYIAGRIRIAGGEAQQVFTRDAVVAIFEAARGIPRTISVVCDNALITGFAADVKPVGPDIVAEVCRDFCLGSRASGNGRGRVARPDEGALVASAYLRPTEPTSSGTAEAGVARADDGSLVTPPFLRPASPTSASTTEGRAASAPGAAAQERAPEGTGAVDGGDGPVEADNADGMFANFHKRRRFLFF